MYRSILALLCLCLLATKTNAHGFIIKLVNNKITVHLSEEPILHPDTSAVVEDSFFGVFTEFDPGSPLFTDHGGVTGLGQPGFTIHQTAQGGDDQFRFEVLSPLVFSNATTTGFANPSAELLLLKGANSVTLTGATNPQPGFAIRAHSSHEVSKYLSHWTQDGAFAFAYRLTGQTATGAPFIASDPLVAVYLTPNFIDPENTDPAVMAAGTYAAYIAALGMWQPSAGGNWGDPANWTNRTVPNGNTTAARLWGNLSGPGTISLQNTDRIMKSLSFEHATSAYTVAAGTGKLILAADAGNATLSAGGAASHTIIAGIAISSHADIITSGTSSLELSGGIDNSAGKNITLSNGSTGSLTVSNIANNGTLTTTGIVQINSVTGTGATSLSADSILTANHVRQTGALTLMGSPGNPNGKLTVRTSGGNAPAGDVVGTSRVGTLSIASNEATIGAGPYTAAERAYQSTLDLNNNALIINNPSATLLSEIGDMIRSGMADLAAPTWTGTGITSSFAADTINNPFAAAGATGLGSIRNVVDPSQTLGGSNPALFTSFSGQTGLTGNEIIVKFTWNGDFNLDGKVTACDYALFDAGYAGAIQDDNLPGWYYGDANYNGVVDSADLALLNGAYSAYVGAGFATLPEPSAFALVLFGLGGLVCRARRWKQRGR